MGAQVVVVIGAGGIGIEIARRQDFGKHILLADFNEALLEKAAAKAWPIWSSNLQPNRVWASAVAWAFTRCKGTTLIPHLTGDLTVRKEKSWKKRILGESGLELQRWDLAAWVSALAAGRQPKRN